MPEDIGALGTAQNRDLRFMVIINLLAVLGFLASAAYVIRKHTAYIPFFALQSITHLWALVSCYYNDLGIYNIELFRFTDTTLATTHLALFYIVFNLGFMVAAKLLGRRPLARRDFGIVGGVPDLGNFKLLLMVAVAALMVYEAFSLVTNGIPLLTGVDREAFSQKKGLVNELVLTWGIFAVFFLGMRRREGSRLAVQDLWVALIVVYAILTGHKFSFPFTILVFYYMPISMRRLRRDPSWNPFRFRTLALGLTVCLVFGGFVYGIYSSDLEDNNLAQALITHRVLALQGEVWWAVDNEVAGSGTYDKRHWEDELACIVSPDRTSANQVGMRYLMIKMLGREKAYPVMDSGYLYTMAYPAILIVTFPYVVALLIQFLAGIIFFVFVYYLFFCVVYRHYARAVIGLLATYPFTVALATGNFYVFFTLGMVIKIGTLICLESVPTGAFHWPQIAPPTQSGLEPNVTNSTSSIRRL